MRGFWNFIKYNNTVPLALGALFLSTGAAFAASSEARSMAASAVYSREQQVLSVDNTYLVNKDLSSYTPRVQITSVTEDDEFYYVGYTLSTIDLVTYAWQDAAKSETMRVSKADLGQYGDLGLYVTAQLRQVVERELTYLKDAQEKERRAVSAAVVSTTYGGLVGQFLDPTTEMLPGYVPVVAAPVEVASGSFSAPSDASVPADQASAGAQGASVGLQVMGNNPARVPVGASYIDLGVFLYDPHNTNAGVRTYLNGVEVFSSPSVDTSTTTSYAIEYRVADPKGGEVMARRIVLVGSAADPGGAVSAAGLQVSSAPAPVQESAPAPSPAPEEPSATTTQSVAEEPPQTQPAPQDESATSTPDTAQL